MRVEGEPAFILHQRPYRETSNITELFSLHHGRISVVARGARRPLKKGSNPAMPFQQYIAGWTGRSELLTLTQFEPEGQPANLAGERLYCGLYINELLMRLLHQHDPHERLYSRYMQTLTLLEHDADLQPALRMFERDLLSELGYGLVLDHDIQLAEPVEPEATYDYIIDEGPRRAGTGPISGIEITGKCLIALSDGSLGQGRLVQSEMSQVRNLMRTIIDARLDGKPLNSRKMMQRMRKNQQEVETG